MRNPRSKDEASRSKKRLHVEERNSRANPKRSVTPSKVEVLKSEIAHCPRIPATVEVAFFWFAHCPRIPLPLHSRKLLVFGKISPISTGTLERSSTSVAMLWSHIFSRKKCVQIKPWKLEADDTALLDLFEKKLMI
ncbi:uncharacterized protein LOC116204573 isoform X1 [Punica granatum]|uniref:Uncharacterized protein LOC116204573 isoform X1 n=1 Tax=Punica granatum TaxID=22663 RepID=A0A6P8D629_PUNGR|nr:uncharacterized protein LOC116204573 isoform X1 [Punica granatum]